MLTPPSQEPVSATAEAVERVRHALEDAIETFPDTKWFEAYYESPAALVTLAAALERAERERDEFRIEADQGLTEYDGLELSFGIVGDALQQIATGRRNERFDPWAQKLARETLASLPEQHRAALASPAAEGEGEA
jgi:hypothetical protein